MILKSTITLLGEELVEINKDQIYSFIKKFNLPKYLNTFGQEFKSVENGNNPQLNLHTCPFCNNINYKGNVHPYRFYISRYLKLFNCFNCKEEGGLFKFIAKLEGKQVQEIFNKFFGGDYWESLPKELTSELIDPFQQHTYKEEFELEEISLPDEFEPIFNRPSKKYQEAYKYLMDRGIFDIDTLELEKYNKVYKIKDLGQDLDIRYVNYYKEEIDGKIFSLSKRIVFPIYWQGKVVGWQGRDITGKSKLKYFISKGFRKQAIIYNYDNVYDKEVITITEGIFDAIKCWSHNPICLFGKSISKTQLKYLQEMPNLRKIIVALDQDTKLPIRGGDSRTPFDALIEQLNPFWDIEEVLLPEGKDCGDMSYLDMREALNNSSKIGKNILVSNLL